MVCVILIGDAGHFCFLLTRGLSVCSELTGELSVIAAEMPYFIYNDNDTEVEVSIENAQNTR